LDNKTDRGERSRLAMWLRTLEWAKFSRLCCMREEAMKTLSEESIGRLTEYPGECFHDPLWHDLRGSVCEKCDVGLNGIFDLHRSFTSGNDMLELKEKLAEKGDWKEFYYWSALQHAANPEDHVFTQWLFTMPRFAELVDSWLKEKGEKP